jgi:hypothetical protein
MPLGRCGTFRQDVVLGVVGLGVKGDDVMSRRLYTCMVD